MGEERWQGSFLRRSDMKEKIQRMNKNCLRNRSKSLQTVTDMRLGWKPRWQDPNEPGPQGQRGGWSRRLVRLPARPLGTGFHSQCREKPFLS